MTKPTNHSTYDQSLPITYTNRFYIGMLAVFATYNPSLGRLNSPKTIYTADICKVRPPVA